MGVLVSLVLGLLGVVVFALLIGVWLVPISVLLGLVYVIIRRAVRLERGGDAVPRS